VGAARNSLIATVCLATSIASAGPRRDELRPPKDRPPSRTQRYQAQRHYNKATKWFKTGDYDKALDELHAAFDADPVPDYLYAIARVHEKLDHCADAITYYKRYLDSNPGPLATHAAVTAIDACKEKLPPPEEPKPVKAEPPKAPPPEPEPEPEPEPKAPPPAPKPPRTAVRTHWYSDKLGDGLLIGGFAAGGAGAFFYVAALGDLDAAESSLTLDEHVKHFDDARSKRLYALVLGGAGVTLATAAIVHFVRYDRRERRHVALVPTGGGALAVVGGSF
jgi:tetratricopeptide (TPR) repeat protein